MLPSSPRLLRQELEEILRTMDTGITARSISSPLSETVQITAQVSLALKYMKDRKFDRIVVLDGQNTVGYVNIEDLEEVKGDRGALVKKCVSTFGPDLLISEETPLPVVLHRLRKQSSLFIVGRDGLSGIVTQADLEKQFMRVYAFSLVSLMEQEMGQLMETLSPSIVANAIVGEFERGKFEATFADKTSADAELAPIYYVSLGVKIKLFVQQTPYWQLLGDSPSTARQRLSHIKELRDKLDHVKPLINPTDNLEILDATIEDLTDVIRKLEAATRQP
jgi:predicted transcriptional regulator